MSTNYITFLKMYIKETLFSFKNIWQKHYLEIRHPVAALCDSLNFTVSMVDPWAAGIKTERNWRFFALKQLDYVAVDTHDER